MLEILEAVLQLETVAMGEPFESETTGEALRVVGERERTFLSSRIAASTRPKDEHGGVAQAGGGTSTKRMAWGAKERRSKRLYC
jgi:hypothetical protein